MTFLQQPEAHFSCPVHLQVICCLCKQLHGQNTGAQQSATHQRLAGWLFKWFWVLHD
jgi:hypothetical protein